MSTSTRVAAAAAIGYFLGRTKKLKLAIAAGSMLAGRRLATNPRAAFQQATDFIESRPELARLSEQARTTLFAAARGAAVSGVSQRIDRLSDSIRDRSDRLTSLPAGGGDDETAQDEPAEQDEDRQDEEPQDEDRQDEEPQDEDRQEEESGDEQEAPEEPRDRKPAKKPARKRAASPARQGKQAAKATPAKATPAKRSPAKKTSASSGARKR